MKSTRAPGKRSVRRTHRLSMQKPAVRWQDALPCGNGALGALVYGNVAHETIVLNHERLWYGSATMPLPDISAHLPRLRHLLDQDRYEEANVLFPSLLK